LRFNEFGVLDNAGIIRKDMADKLAEDQYAKYKIIHDKDQSAAFKGLAKNIQGTSNLPVEQLQEKK
jgi:hypothetical protein